MSVTDLMIRPQFVVTGKKKKGLLARPHSSRTLVNNPSQFVAAALAQLCNVVTAVLQQLCAVVASSTQILLNVS